MKQLLQKFGIVAGVGIVLGTLLTAAPVPAYAQGLVNCGNADLKEGQTQLDDACTITDLFRLVVTVTNFLIAFAGLIAVVIIVREGFNMVVSAGNPQAYTNAKKMLGNAILGLILVFAAFMLVNTLLTTALGIQIKDGQNIFQNTIDFIRGPGTTQ